MSISPLFLRKYKMSKYNNKRQRVAQCNSPYSPVVTSAEHKSSLSESLLYSKNISESMYCSIIREIAFDECNLHQNPFEIEETKVDLYQDKLSRTSLKILSLELHSLQCNIPISDDAIVSIRISSVDIRYISFMITGPKNTPYSFGCFVFDMIIPKGYPSSPPLVTLRTTGNNTVMFNPNLYKNGKVCLSLLGTWPGDPWIPNVSTLLQIIISIQSLIFVEEPYYNEPSYERYKNTHNSHHKSLSEQMNTLITKNTMEYAMLSHLRNGPENNEFYDVIRTHLSIKFLEIVEFYSSRIPENPLRELELLL